MCLYSKADKPCSVTLSEVQQSPEVWHRSGMCCINECWAVTGSGYGKEQTLILSGFHRAPDVL